MTVFRARWLIAFALVACAVSPNVARGQDASRDSSRVLSDRISPTARASITRVVDSARTAGLPTKPLFDKAAEGVLKGAEDERIVRAVQTLYHELSEARKTLDGSTDVAVLGAAASALHSGVSATDLHALAHPTVGAPEPAALSSALVTLVDLVAKHVPVAMATRSIHDLLERRASDREFVTLRSEVEQDILAGRSPEASLTARVRTVTRP
ncbi:MAG TPA: hypothetical protein VGM50_11125 [Gemmatimonadaceae bacterium]|jgi:hypothetical protein